MSNQQFDDIVAADVRGTLPSRDAAKSKWLRSPEQVHEWHDALTRLSQNVEEQFASREARNKQIQAEYKVATEQGRGIKVTRVVLDINGVRREVSSDQADSLIRKAEKYDNKVQEVERYDTEVTADTAWSIYQADEADWSASAIRFRNAIDRNLAEAKSLIRKFFPDSSVELRRLVEAVKLHRATIHDEDACAADEQLWETLGPLLESQR